MPDNLETIVQRMIDAGEPEENIAGVIRQYNTDNPPAPQKPGPLSPYSGPTDFWGGFSKSLLGNPFTQEDAALRAGAQGALGFAKGATIDIPASIMGGLGQIGNLITSPVETISSIPGGVSNMASNIAQTTQQAGSDPEAFGRMMGQFTGQPAVTAGLVKGAPVAANIAGKAALATARSPVGRAAGVPMASVGNLLAEYQPMSGMMPRFADIRTLRNLEAATGRGLRNLGERLKAPYKTVEGEVLPSDWPPESMAGAQYTEVPPTMLPPPEYPGTFYQGEAAPTPTPSPAPPYYPPSEPLALPPASSIQVGGEMPPTPRDMTLDVQSPTWWSHNRPTPPIPQRALPPASQIQLPGEVAPNIPMDVQSPTAGMHMNTPPTPHNIPPATPSIPRTLTPYDVDYARLKYLTDKDIAGKLTAIELDEAQVLNRKLRQANFERDAYNQAAASPTKGRGGRRR